MLARELLANEEAARAAFVTAAKEAKINVNANSKTFRDDVPGNRPGWRVYGDDVRAALVVVWEASDRICGKRLHPLLTALIEAMERHGHGEADLVSHSGPYAKGALSQTLVLTDIATGWTECAPLLVRKQTVLITALAELAGNVCFLSSLRWAHPETHCYRNLGSLKNDRV